MTEQSAFKKALKTHYFKSAFQETIDQQSDILFMDNFEWLGRLLTAHNIYNIIDLRAMP